MLYIGRLITAVRIIKVAIRWVDAPIEGFRNLSRSARDASPFKLSGNMLIRTNQGTGSNIPLNTSTIVLRTPNNPMYCNHHSLSTYVDGIGPDWIPFAVYHNFISGVHMSLWHLIGITLWKLRISVNLKYIVLVLMLLMAVIFLPITDVYIIIEAKRCHVYSI